MQQYQISVQRELFSDTVVTAAYVGSRGNHLARVADVNTPVPTIRADGKVVYPSSGIRPNPVFGSLARQIFDATSAYNSLQLSLRKRFSRGVLYQMSYTLAESVDDASGTSAGGDGFDSSNTHTLLANNRDYDRGNSAFDVRHVFTSSFVWELPFGPEKRFGSSMSGVTKAFLADWQLGGTLSMRSGTHTSVYVSSDRAGNLSSAFFGQRPDLVPGADPNPIDPGNPAQYISAASFAIPERFTLGNLPRGTLTMPGQVTLDFSMTKAFPIGNGNRIQFRAEMFNALNRANFGTPNLTVVAGSASAPTISPTFGRITSTSTAARQVQLGLKLIF
jgi:hypothetical protein